MLDVGGLALSGADRRRLAHPATGGVILFARNFAERRQLIELVREVRAVRSDLLVAVDHEGGRVQRFRGDGFTILPAMARLGELWDRDASSGALQACSMASAVGVVLATELLECGVDLSFTPVLDLDHAASSVIGDRALHRDARVVTLLAKSLMHGLALAGMANCGKHFPGHGFAAADSHTACPVDDRPLEDILGQDAAPYAWLAVELDAVMPAHVSYPQVDSAPAGFSRIWLQGILRERLAFAGAIFSDDLSMAGARGQGSVVEAASLALDAGCDMVLVCNDPERADLLLDGLAAARALAPPSGRVARLVRAQRSTRHPAYLQCRDRVQRFTAAGPT